MSKPYDQVYYETLFDAVYACVEEYKGIIKLDSEYYEDWGFDAMNYETAQTRIVPGIKLVKTSKGKSCGLHISVYRMPSGRYEVTGYVTA